LDLPFPHFLPDATAWTHVMRPLAPAAAAAVAASAAAAGGQKIARTTPAATHTPPTATAMMMLAVCWETCVWTPPQSFGNDTLIGTVGSVEAGAGWEISCTGSSTAATEVGIRTRVEQAGQVAFLPAAAAGALIRLSHLGQLNRTISATATTEPVRENLQRLQV